MARKKLGGRRPGAGRPRTVGGSSSKEMGLVMGDDLARDVEQAARDLGITKGELLRRLVRMGLTEKKQLVTIRKELGGR